MNLMEERKVYSNVPAQFMGACDGQTIYQVGAFGNKAPIGVTQQAYDELKGICQGYYDKLVELGVITKPKTSEEIQAEQTKIMTDMYAIVQNLKQEVEVLKNERRVNSKTDEYESPKRTKTIRSVEPGPANGAGNK